jgi:hypothetical protein
MNNTQIVRKIVEDLAKEIEDWGIKSSNIHSSDADGFIGFRKDIPENEYDPRTGKIVKNDKIGDHATYLNHWDGDNTGYLEGEDIQRDNGVGLARIVMQQITPIKS